jgi:spermidine synthase
VSERLAPGGVLQQWVQLHHILPRDFATILHTMRERFEHMVLFFGGGQGILVASQRPLQASQSRAERFERDPRLWRTIPEVRDASGNTTRRGLFSLLNDALVANEGLDAYVSQVARKAGEPVASLVSTDDNLYLEYATPRGNVLDWSARDELIQEILRFRSQTQVDILRAK